MNRKLGFIAALGSLVAFSVSLALGQQQSRSVPGFTKLVTQAMPHYGVETTFTLLPAGGSFGQDMIRMTIRPNVFPARWDEESGILLSPGTQDPRRPKTATFTLGSDVYQLFPTGSGIMTLTLPKSDYDQPVQYLELAVYDADGVLIQGVGPIGYSLF